MEQPYSMFWKRHPSPSQQAAVQTLNEKGLFPTKNNRADFLGKWPAPIVLERTYAPGCEAMYNAAPCGECPCNGCCPGQTPTPWSEIVRRNTCSHCPGANGPIGLQAPATNASRPNMINSITKHQAIAIERNTNLKELVNNSALLNSAPLNGNAAPRLNNTNTNRATNGNAALIQNNANLTAQFNNRTNLGAIFANATSMNGSNTFGGNSNSNFTAGETGYTNSLSNARPLIIGGAGPARRPFYGTSGGGGCRSCRG